MNAPQSRTMQRRNEGYLNPFVALWYALSGKSAAFFPRVHDETSGKTDTIDSSEVMVQIARGLSELKANKEGIAKALDLARASLQEVKDLTEYQDQKATRLLTILAFLSALAGGLFSRLADLIPAHSLLAPPPTWTWYHQGLAWTAYVVFVLFVIFLIGGALVTFKATQSRFRFPKSIATKGNGALPAVLPKSRMFYVGMLSVSPADWAASFLDRYNPKALSPALELDYLKNYISESYLIAGKVADKLRYLMPAQWFQQMAIRILLIWALLFAATVVLVPPIPKANDAAATPHSESRLVQTQPATRSSTGESVPTTTTTALTAPSTATTTTQEIPLRGRTE